MPTDPDHLLPLARVELAATQVAGTVRAMRLGYRKAKRRSLQHAKASLEEAAQELGRILAHTAPENGTGGAPAP